jgi:hypothetical protein
VTRTELQTALDTLNGRHYLVSDDLTEEGFEAWTAVTAASRSWLRLLPDENGEWDMALVIKVAAAMREGPIDDLYHGQACAVLSALVEEG